jgi:hypothetical protein
MTRKKTVTNSDERRIEPQRNKRLEQLNRRTLKHCDKCGCDLCPGCDYDHDCFTAEREARRQQTRLREGSER